MSVVGGFDIHRKQITFDYVDTLTGQVSRGQITSADRRRLATWLERFAGSGEVSFAVEACTGWRYVVEELRRAGAVAYLAEPADTAAARGRKRRAKTDRTDARLIRELLEQDRLPRCYIPPSEVLEYRALLELYHDLRTERGAWMQRVHAVLFHQGATQITDGLSTVQGRQQLEQIAAGQLSPAGQLQVATAVAMLDALDDRLDQTHRQLVGIARHLRGARQLTDSLYGGGAGHRVGADVLAGRCEPVQLRAQGGPVRRS